MVKQIENIHLIILLLHYIKTDLQKMMFDEMLMYQRFQTMLTFLLHQLLKKTFSFNLILLHQKHSLHFFSIHKRQKKCE